MKKVFFNFVLLSLLTSLGACLKTSKNEETTSAVSAPDERVNSQTSANERKEDTEAGGKGNGSGYGLIREFRVMKNGVLEFQVDEKGGLVKSFEIQEKAQNGNVNKLSDNHATYTPNLNYIGLDGFEYSYVNVNGEKYTVKARVNVAPCFKKSLNLPLAKNLHIVSTYNAAGLMPVYVAATEEPMTLVLSSSEKVNWKIVPEKGAKLERVYVNTGYLNNGSTVDLSATPDTQLTNVDLKAYAVGWQVKQNRNGGSRIGTVLNNVRAITGMNETSFQACQKMYEARVPYTFDSLKKLCGTEPPSFYDYKNQNCENKCDLVKNPVIAKLVVFDNTGGANFSNNNLTVEVPVSNTWGTNVFGNYANSCGKKYFEIKMHKVATLTQALGIVADPSYMDQVVYGSFGLVLNWSGKPLYGVGDTIGVGADLDAGSIYFSKNGKWLEMDDFHMNALSEKGAPVLGIGGYDLSEVSYEPYVVGMAIRGGSKATFNFGNTPFSYSPPTGYSGWDKK